MTLNLEDASLRIPRFAWRVKSTKSRLYQTSANEAQQFTNEDLRSFISTHMTGGYYDAPWPITSLTGSLLWGLNYAHWLLSRGYGDIQIFLVDTWKITEGTIYPAAFLAAYLAVAPRNIPWHDDPYHEYLVLGDVPEHAILGSAHLDSIWEGIDTLLPRFSQLDRDERLHESLDRFCASWINIFGLPVNATASITDDDIWAAGVTAGKFLRDPDLNVHFQIAMMFLSLRKRDWNKEAHGKIQSAFQGVCIPSVYLYNSRNSKIDPRMLDVLEWVKGMEHVRIECIIARICRNKILRRGYNKSGQLWTIA